MQLGQNIKLKRWDPQILFRSLRHSVTAILGVGATQLELNGVPFSNVRTVKKTVGAPGVADCDFNFATAANVNEQVIDLGVIIPAFARVLDAKTVTRTAFNSKSVATASRAVASNVATIVTAAAHGLVTGNSVVIAGMADATYNGTYTVTVTNTTTFTYSLTHANETTTADTGGTVTATLTLAADTGTASGGAELIGSATIKAADAITAMNHTVALNIAPSATPKHVYVNATPNVFWANVTTGKVEVYVTYIEV